MMNRRLFWLFLLFLLFAPARAEERITFRTLTTDNGLPSNQITAIYRDTKGFLWVGTFEGLCRYDAYRFRQFSTRDGLPGKNITHIAEDVEGRIWIRTSEGSVCYSYPDDRFAPAAETMSEMGFRIQDPDAFGADPNLRYFWIVAGEQLAVYDAERSVISEYPIPGSSFLASGASQDRIYFTESDGRLHYIDFRTGAREEPAGGDGISASRYGLLRVYADRGGGLWVYSLDNSLLQHYTPSVGWRRETLPGVSDQYNRITDIAEDSSGNLWLSTTHQGLYLFSHDGKVRQIIHDPDNLSSLPGDNLAVLHIDKDDIVWVGNFKLGLSSYSPHSQPISHHFVGGSEDILSFCETQDALYVGTDGSGLLRVDGYGGTFRPVPTGANVINRITQDGRGDLWLGTWENGLIRLAPDGRKKAVYTSENSALSGNSVFSILEGKDGCIYLGMFSGAIQRLEPGNGAEPITTLYRKNDINLFDMTFLNDSTLVAATSDGLIGIGLGSGNTLSGLPDGIIVDDLFTDSRGYLWMAGRRGVWYWDPSSGALVKLGVEDGLPADSGRSFTEDANGLIWIATVHGLCSVDLSKEMPYVQNYGQEDGLGWIEFNKCAMITLRRGDILAGTPRGFTAIVPQKSWSKAFDTPIFLTGAEFAGSDRTLPVLKPVFNPAEIVIRKDMLPLSLHFSCMDFERKDAVTYEYRVNGGDRSWSSMSGPDVDLSYLPAGHYEIRVRAHDAQGLWSPHIKTLSLIVRPPWYWSLPAQIFYLLLIAAALWMLFSYLKQQKARKEALERINKEAEDQKKLMDMKLTFFGNISHELRTPLSLIINPLDEFMRRYPQHGGGFLSTVRNNASYLKELIDELLSFRKIDAGGEVMHYLHQDVVTILKDAFLAYQSIADSRKIAYSFRAEPQIIEMDFDREKINKILRNLLTNAFKFTPDGGRIDVSVRTEEDKMMLRVADTGPGIPEAERGKVFDMFYQVSGDTNPQGGSGIGLYLVNQYIQAHGGGIEIGDNLPHGAVFSLWIPLASEAAAVPEAEKTDRPAAADIRIRGEVPRLFDSTLLLVDDNSEFLSFLKESLSADYRILQATEGAEALEILGREQVDLVVSDVMMPNMSGLELCRIIKGNVRTARIPILLLTAKDGDEFQLEGLNEGADDYISKPFNMDLLKMRIARIIENRRSQNPAFEGEMPVDPSKVVVTPHDRQFVEEAIRVVENNLSDADFSVEDLASALNYSRGYLYKRLLKITGRSPIEFIRTIRMKRAQQLLAESQLQIAEVAYKLGYRSPKTFAKHFRLVFGMTPSEYIRSWKND